VAYNINTLEGGLVTISPTGTSGSTTTTTGSSEATQFFFYNATNPTSPLSVTSGSTTIMQSAGTDKFCRLVPLQGSVPPAAASSSLRTSSSFRTKSAAAPPGFLLTLQCDVTDPAQATPLTYTSTGLMYNGQPILPVGPGGTMVVVPGDSTGSTSTTATPITPVGPVVKPGVPIAINTENGYLSVTSTATSMITNATATGTSPAEQFILTPAGSSTAPIEPGTSTIVQSVATGLYCRVVPDTQEVKCDQPTAATATPVTYTGSGLVYNGVLLGSSGPNQTTSFSTTTTIDPSSPGTGTSISGPGVDAMLVMPGELPTACLLLCSRFTKQGPVWGQASWVATLSMQLTN
jgi:hypothetical protein